MDFNLFVVWLDRNFFRTRRSDMKQLLATAFLAAAALLGLTQDSQASGKFRHCRGGCDTCCETYCAPSAPAPVQYEDRKVVQYRRVMTDKMIEVLECRRVTRDEKY